MTLDHKLALVALYGDIPLAAKARLILDGGVWAAAREIERAARTVNGRCRALYLAKFNEGGEA